MTINTVHTTSTGREESILPEKFPDATEARTYPNVLALIGNTPLVKLNALTAGLPADVYIKLDHYNAAGSSKDRIGLNIIREAKLSGTLAPGARIIDNGAGNTALGFAIVGALEGHPVTIVANKDLAPAKERLLRLYGAEILRGRPDVPFDNPENWEAIAARHADEDPNTWWSHQSANPTNPDAHYLSTGPEIWSQTDGKVTHFLAAIATGGTVSGTGRYLKDQNPAVQVIATDFVEGPNAHNGLGAAIAAAPDAPAVAAWPANIDTALIDALELRTRHDVIDFGWKLARTEGLVLGLSSVLSVLVALDLARGARDGDVIVSFSADNGRDYLDQAYNPEWLRANNLGDIADKYEA